MKTLSVITLATTVTTVLLAQVAGFPPSELTVPQQQLLRQQQDPSVRGEQTPADNVVDAEQYQVGPGDVLVVQKLDALAQEEYVTVTPENMVIVPRIGMISARGMTLRQLRDTVVALYRQRTPNIPVYIGLRRTRTVYVTVQGNVLFPGVYSVPASVRLLTLLRLAMQGSTQQRTEPEVQRAVQRAFGQIADLRHEEQLLWRDYEFLPPSSLRSLLVRHSDATTTVVDGEQALLQPESSANPYLREGDVVFVPREPVVEQPRLTIQGAVARPRTTVYRQGDRLSFLLKLGGALLPESGAIWLVQGGERIPVRADAQLNLLSEDIALQPGAAVLVERIRPEPTSTGSVRIVGEVQRPGAYPIVQWGTRLREIIDEAGGFTNRAALHLAYILRRPTGESTENTILPINPHIERLRRLQYTNLIIEDTLRFFIDEIARRPTVACDFFACFMGGSEQDNVALADGDVIVVPPTPRTVLVYGQVNKAGFVEYSPGKDAEYYIACAGGRTELADRGRERVIKGRSGVWMPLDETVVEAGDRIYVPHPPDEPIGTQIQRLSAYIGIAGGLSGLVFSIISLINFLRTR
ncbi:MAG: SLBB domain-containing protein [Chlorobi bacterium]|nr:SLBB domain-containing protein [Chlorobiota bacterium]